MEQLIDNKLFETEITSNEEISPGVYILRFPKKYKFRAGQCIGLTTNSEVSPRLYSIASAETEDEIQVLYNLKDDGWLTPRLSALKAGTKLYTTAPKGDYFDDNTPAWWIASGTGIAPFSSMFRSGLTENKTIIHGGRTVKSFYFEEEFKTKLKNKYFRCCSQEQAEGLYNGRLTQYLEEYENLPKDVRYFLCGSPEMVVDVRDLLIRKGIEFEKIIAEIYF